ncbi:BAR-domain-containing protein [Choiromyces venosus 120613-1]|uniref:BAR-domain-containing protein n=1 Tax=Choiromyces venosus 120613-1 TaxID=1336337 RepID=A0A3N4K4Z4_9PEZI|nr:BAR-domain-containing protein [Choiromyces venosus 120613-1]
MMMNKKLDRLKQWAGERMGGEVKTGASDEFQNLEVEMKLRHEGAEKLHNTMNVYIKSVSQKSVGEDREKMLPVDVMAQAMISHGEEFESDSVFGNCLIKMGHANEKIARVQDSYVAAASESWLESLERFLTQMKEYQAARRKLESRRLAYDATLSKMQKQKKEDFRVEEELRAQRIKYEESSEDVYRRMGDIQESETETMSDLTAFLDAELEYHDRCRDILMSVRENWPAGLAVKDKKRLRSRSNTAHSFGNGSGMREESPPPPLPQVERPSIRSRVNNTGGSPESDDRSGPFRMPTPDHNDRLSTKPVFHRTTTSPMPGRFSQYESESMGRRRSDQGGPPPLPTTRTLRSANTDVFSDSHSRTSSSRNSPEREKSRYEERSISPARSTTSSTSRGPSRSSSNNALSGAYNAAGGGRKQAPPPPVSRGLKKPPPPPPPAKRSQLSAAYEN